MGKKTVKTQEGSPAIKETKPAVAGATRRRKGGVFGKAQGKDVQEGKVYVNATYNNTVVTVTDTKGNVLAWASAGSLGFSGPKKATPFASSKVIAAITEKIQASGPKDISVIVKASVPAATRPSAHSSTTASIFFPSKMPRRSHITVRARQRRGAYSKNFNEICYSITTLTTMHGPKEKKERALGVRLGLKGDRATSPKSALTRKPYKPGAHGPRSRPKALSEFGLQLREKAKFKIAYGVNENNMKRLVYMARAAKGASGMRMLELLESRLDPWYSCSAGRSRARRRGNSWCRATSPSIKESGVAGISASQGRRRRGARRIEREQDIYGPIGAYKKI